MKLNKMTKWELKNMIKALSSFKLLNSKADNKRLKEAKQALKDRL